MAALKYEIYTVYECLKPITDPFKSFFEWSRRQLEFVSLLSCFQSSFVQNLFIIFDLTLLIDFLK